MVTGNWATVEQDPTGLWWITTNDTTIGPYLDEVQATRALHTTTDAPSLQCALQTTAARPETEGGV